MTWTKPTKAYVVISFMGFLRADYLKFRAPCIHAVSGEDPFSKILGYPRLEAKARGVQGVPSFLLSTVSEDPKLQGVPGPGCFSSVTTAPVISHC